MSEVIISGLILAAEVAAVVVTVAVVAAGMVLVRRRRRRAHARSFVSLVEHHEQARAEQLRAACGEPMSEDDARRVQAVQDQERRLYARILALFRGAGRAALDGVEQEIDRLVALSRDLGAASRPPAPAPQDRVAHQRVVALEERLRAAEDENLRLRGQLHDTQEALDQLHQEYEALYERERNRA
jgi:hypothetical protein